MADTPTAVPDAIARPDYRLADSLWANGGAIFLTGTQALVRLLLMQRQRDEAAGLDTRGFLSGYRGSRTRSAPAKAYSPCGTARAPAWTAQATR